MSILCSPRYDIDLSSQDSSFDELYLLSGECLGRGKFAYVFTAFGRCDSLRNPKEEYAVKIYCKDSVKSLGRLIENEICALSMLPRHPNIIHLEDVFKSDLGVYLVFPRLRGGDLASHFLKQYKEGAPYTEHQIRLWCKSLLSAVDHCHRHRILHRDIKPNNIMVDSDSPHADIKLVDFGLAVHMKAPHCCGTAGTLPYLAPEMIKKEPYSYEIDMWSYGVTVYTLLTGRLPFLSSSEFDMKAKILKAIYPPISGLSPSSADFVSHLLVVDSKSRLTSSLALQHFWITDDNPDSVKPLVDSASNLSTFFRMNTFGKAVSLWVSMRRWKRRALSKRHERDLLLGDCCGSEISLSASKSCDPVKLFDSCDQICKKTKT